MLNRPSRHAQSPFWSFGFGSLGGALVALGLVTLALYGCITHPVNVTKNTEQRAYALYGEFVIFEEQAAQLRNSVTPQIFVVIQHADAIAKPTADSLLQAVRDYDAVATQVRAGAGTENQLSTVTANLEKWVTQADTDIASLISAVKGAKQ